MVLIEKIQKIRQLRIEQDKLLQVLEFYAWLETHGVQHDNVRGLRPLDNTVVSRGEFKCSCRRNGMMELYDELRHAYFIEVDEPNQYGYCRLRWKKVPKNYDGPEEVVRRPYAYTDRFLDIMLKDGQRVILPWPPYPEELIYGV